jgi:hypothetical protein
MGVLAELVTEYNTLDKNSVGGFQGVNVFCRIFIVVLVLELMRIPASEMPK